MTTIANLVIAASIDPTGVRSGLDTSLGYLQGYATVATDVLKKATAGAAVEANATAATYLKGLNDSFRAGQAALRVNLFSGAMSTAEYEAHAAQNAIAYNAALSAGIAKFTRNGFDLKDMYPLVDAFKRTGLEASGAIVASSGAGLQGLSRIRLGLTSLLAQFTGTIPVLDRVGSQLLLFGTGGNVALAVIAGLAAIAGAWHYATAEAREHTKAVEEGTKALREWYKTEQEGPAGKLGTDLDAARETLRNLQKARADLLRESSGTGLGEAGLVQQAGARGMLPKQKQELDTLAGQIKEAEDRVTDILRKAAQDRVDAQVRDLATIVTAHKATADQIQLTRNLIAGADADIARLQGSNKPEDMDVLAKTIQTRKELSDALNPKKDIAEANKAWNDHIATIRAVVEAYTTLVSEHVVTSAAGLKLLSTYAAVNAELARSTDLTSEHSAALLKLRAEMERTSLIASLSGPAPAIQQTLGGASALAGQPQDATASAQRLVDRARLLAEAGQQTTQAYRDTIAALRIVDGYLSSANAHEGLTNDRLREQLAIRQLLASQTAPVTQTPFMSDLNQQAASAQRMLALAEAARRAGSSNAGELEAAANAQRERAVSLIRVVLSQSANWNNLTEQQRAELEQVVALVSGLTPATSDATTGFRGVSTALHGVLDAAAGLGAIPKALRDGVTSAEHLLSAVQQIQKAQEAASKPKGGGWDAANILGAAGGAIGAVGAGISLVQTFVGLFQHHDAVLEANTRKLDELRLAMVDTKGVSGQQAALAATQAFLQPGNLVNATMHGQQTLEQVVKDAGLTMEQFNKIAADLGIQVGHTAGGVNAFRQALQLAIDAAGKFGQSLSDQTSLIALQAKVNNKTAPLDQINDALTLLGQFAPKLRAQIGAIDTTTTQGQAALRAALQNLVQEIVSNSLTPDELGALGGVKDLAQIIDTLAGGLNSLTSSVNSAAASINNVAWYKINEAIYGTPGMTAVGNTVTGVAGRPATSPVIPTTGSDTSPWSPPSAPQLTLTGDVIIQVPTVDPETLRRTVLRAFQQKAFTDFGSSALWPQVQS